MFPSFTFFIAVIAVFASRVSCLPALSCWANLIGVVVGNPLTNFIVSSNNCGETIISGFSFGGCVFSGTPLALLMAITALLGSIPRSSNSRNAAIGFSAFARA